MSKYHSVKVVVDGKMFDSKAEAKRYQELKIMEKAGQIKCLTLQPSFELIPAFKKNGKSYRAMTYRADFEYYKDGNVIIEDVKGVETEVFKLKKKLFEYKYPDLTIVEVKK